MNSRRPKLLPAAAVVLLPLGILLQSCATGESPEELGLGAAGSSTGGVGGDASGGAASEQGGTSGQGGPSSNGGTAGAAGSMAGSAGLEGGSAGTAGQDAAAGDAGEAGNGGDAGQAGDGGAAGLAGGASGTGASAGASGTAGSGGSGGTPGSGGSGGTPGSGGSGGTAGSGGTMDGGTCPGALVGSTCVFLAGAGSFSSTAALSKCQSLGAGWDLCSPTVICDNATLSYLSIAGCDCDGGPATCACGSTNNAYIHANTGSNHSYYIRTALIPGCNWGSDACSESVGESCGSALCCK